MIYAQHGYGKSDKIETGLREGSLAGVILSPRNESPEKMIDFVDHLRQEFLSEIDILFDPQFYVSTISDPNLGYLAEYPYHQARLTRGRFVSPTDVNRYAEQALAYQTDLSLDRLIAPTVMFDDFRDPWSQIALQLAQESTNVHATLDVPPPLLVSLAFDESALRSREAADEFLDIISLWDVAGFYLLVRQNDSSYPAQFDESVLANLMYFVYTLSEINDFEVVCGYSDLTALPLHAVGATAAGTGWFNSLRQFSLTRFLPAIGGQPARARYTSGPLLNSILVVPELQTIYEVGSIDGVLSSTTRDGTFATTSPADVPWPANVASLHHWEVISGLASQIAGQGSIPDKLGFLEDLVQGALGRYTVLDEAGVPFQAPSGPRNLHLTHRAIRSFRLDAGI